MVSNTLSSACLYEENSIAEAIWFSEGIPSVFLKNYYAVCFFYWKTWKVVGTNQLLQSEFWSEKDMPLESEIPFAKAYGLWLL